MTMPEMSKLMIKYSHIEDKRQMFIKILEERPKEEIIAKYMMPDGVYNAERMIKAIKDNDMVALQWILDTVDVVSDWLVRQSKTGRSEFSLYQ